MDGGASASNDSGAPPAASLKAHEFRFDQLRPRDEISHEDLAASVGVVRSWAEAAGLSQADLAELVERHNEVTRRPDLHEPEAIARRVDATLRGLRKVWGNEFNNNMAAARRAVVRLDNARGDLVWLLEDTGLGNDPFMIRKFADIARAKGW